MITLYNSKTRTFTATTGEPVTEGDLALNVIIELRVLQEMLLQLARANETETPASIRNDIVNDAVNPSI